jgi:ParB-like nuclease domain
MPIDVANIIGTADRERDFNREFTALQPRLRERQRRLARAFPDGAFAPIVVEKLGDAYFVVDGHHRVAVARLRGMATIDAEVTELTARWHLSGSADAGELLHAQQERLFMSESGLADVRPDARLRFTRAVGYRQLLEAVQIHGYTMMLGARRPLDPVEVARDWYANVYRPTVDLIAAAPMELCAGATESDAFLTLWDHRRELSVEHAGLQLPDALRMPIEIGKGRRRRRRLQRRR